MTLHAQPLHARPLNVQPHPATRPVVRPATRRTVAGRALVVLLVAAGAVTLPAPSPAAAARDTVLASAPVPQQVAARAAYRSGLGERASRSGARARLVPRPAVPGTAVAPPVVVTERLALPFRTLRRADATRDRGTETVLAPGRAGVLERTYADLGPAGRTLLREERVREPQDRVVAVGTRPRPAHGGLDWAALARCESGGDPRAVSSSGRYRGLYQFSLSTWRSVGGTGDPVDHSRDSQTAHAWKLYQRDGRAPWPECGRHL